MQEKLAQLWPEISLFITTCIVMVVGLSKDLRVRRLCAPICFVGLAVALALSFSTIDRQFAGSTVPWLAYAGKPMAAVLGMMLLLLIPGVADRNLEAAVARGGRFEPIRSTRAEFYSFFMFSITGLMLTSGATDLIFLFLALELTSLPTYVMVAISTARSRSMEAAVKYFFLGALGAATFLYGFALLYGATGTTTLSGIANAFREQAAVHGSINALGMAGLILAVLGVLFKIAAVPMHFYTPDVYQGAASSVTAFLAFVPKASGFFALMLLLACAGWIYGVEVTEGGGLLNRASRYGAGHSLPEVLRVLLWTIAVLTMTVGNVLALLQSSVKRILAYSSIAHSGYMLVGIIAGPGPLTEQNALGTNGLAAVLFYLFAYGVMSVGAFSVLTALERRNADGSVDEVDHIHELRGLYKTRPAPAAVMVVSAFGLLGLPPLAGFIGKLPLFTSALGAGETALVVILAINSAIAAAYYLRLVATPFLDENEPVSLGKLQQAPFGSRLFVGGFAAAMVIAIGVFGGYFADFAVRGAMNVPGAARFRTSAAAPAPAPPAPFVGNAAAIADPVR